MKYLKKFQNHTQYDTYSASTEYLTPNVSYCAQEDEVHYGLNSEPPTPTAAIEYTASTKLNVDLTAFTPAATAETFADGVGKIEFASGVTAIGEAAFSEKNALTSIVIPDSVTSIGRSAFEWCGSLTSCTIGSGVTSIGGWAFYHCIDLTNIDIPSGVTSIGISAFDGCTSLTSIDIPSGVTSISDTTFNSCSSLTSAIIPNSVTSIGNQAFKGCTSLTSIDIPSSVTSINYYVFSGCTSLTSITCEATTPPTLRSNAFNNTNNCPIYVPSASVNTYKTASGWSTYSSRIQAIP